AKIINPDNAEIVSKIQRFEQIRDQQITNVLLEPESTSHLVTCPTCKVLVAAKNLQKHIKKIHDTGAQETTIVIN
ncbi:MAG: hypothetical protein AAB322_07245, partial [Pseudomonadota bacterium]